MSLIVPLLQMGCRLAAGRRRAVRCRHGLGGRVLVGRYRRPGRGGRLRRRCITRRHLCTTRLRPGVLPAGAGVLRSAPVYYRPAPVYIQRRRLLPRRPQVLSPQRPRTWASPLALSTISIHAVTEKPALGAGFLLCCRASHGAEQVRVEAADRDLLGAGRAIADAACPASSRCTDSIASLRTTTARCTCQNTSGVELRQQLLERRADQVFLRRGEHAHVLVGGLEIQHLVDRHHAHRVAGRHRWRRSACKAACSRSGAGRGTASCAQAASATAPACSGARASSAGRRWRARQRLLQPRHGLAQALGLHGLAARSRWPGRRRRAPRTRRRR